jgi:aspartate aminotransferase
MELSGRISAVSPSATIAMAARAAQMRAEGEDVVNFGAGEPDFDTPQFVKDACIAALQAGDTKYTPRKGKELQAAVARKLARDSGLQYESDQIVMSFGAKYALYVACQALVSDGDRVLIPAPYWTSYPEMVKLAGGTPVFLPTTLQDEFKIGPDQLRRQAANAKVFILSSPSNPTGVTYTPSELAALAEAILETDCIVFSDETYEKLVYGDTKFVSFAALEPSLPQRTMTFNSLSKTYSMTGWRLGWAAGPKEVIAAMRRFASHATTNPVSFVQAGGLAAYTTPEADETIEAMRREFERRARHMAERLNAIDGVVCVPPTGAFYCFPDVSAHYGRAIGGVEVTDSLSFCRAALEAGRIAIVHGAAFGEDRCVRLSFATSMEAIDEGLDRLERLLA